MEHPDRIAEVTDEALLARLRSGEDAALDELYGRYARKLFVFLSAAMGVRQPEDVVHDTFLRVIEAARQFDARRASFRSWLFRIARNRVTDLRRREHRVRFETLDQTPDGRSTDKGPVDAALQEDLSAAVRDCLAGLDTEQERQAFVLYHLGGKVLREVGEVFGKSIGTARNWIASATEKMRACLRLKGVEP